jgi:aminopeptidase-like protein
MPVARALDAPRELACRQKILQGAACRAHNSPMFDAVQRHDPMHDWMRDLFPICRSLTGEGVRETLRYFQNLLPELRMREVPSGYQAFDWTVPDEWNIEDAWIEDESGRRVVDFRVSNLHVVSYSEPVDITLTKAELEQYVNTIPDMPDAIPYITSYFKRRWGFCLSHNQWQALPEGRYRCVIRSELKPGVLNYADAIIPGDSEQEVLLSSYVCHPSMCNNELSGPAMAIALARWLKSLPRRRYTYRIVLAPETTGAIVYISKNLEALRKNTIAGYVLTCVGDPGQLSYLASRRGDTLADRAAIKALSDIGPYRSHSFLERGSDERQYCSPGVDLPVCSIMRSRYLNFPEYHTSLDNLDFVTQEAMEGCFDAYTRCISYLERNYVYTAVNPCEPQLGKRGLYPTLSTRGNTDEVRAMLDLLTYADGERDALACADHVGIDFELAARTYDKLYAAGLLERSETVKKYRASTL